MMRAIEAEHGGQPLDLLIRERLQRGASVRQIAKEFNVHYTMIYDWLLLLDIPAPARAPRNYGVVEAGR